MRDDEGRQIKGAGEGRQVEGRQGEGRQVETAVEARAGFLDRPVLVVLCLSLVLGVAALGAIWLGFFGSGA
jgi:hypothetical protein